jgi:signal transduction histidine kinase
MTGLRPLDPLRSIKVKLGVLVAASVAVASLFVWYGLQELGWWPRYTLPVAVLAALAVTQLLARGMTAPLRSMTAAARAMARGDYTRRVHTASRDEVGELARAFNRMAADLEAADAGRRELIANVSHELRTPITALQAVLENVVDGVAEPDPATVRLALAQTERLGRLVTELLDLSRIDEGSQPLDRADLRVGPVVAAAVAEVGLGAPEVTFCSDVEPADLHVYADEARLRQILANLLDNAARHSPSGATVVVRARPTPDGTGGTQLEVIDDGPGVPAEERDLVFDRFYRSSTQPSGASGGDSGGTGLGLAIVRWAVLLHDGQVRLTDGTGGTDGTATGCRFVVELPGRAG